MFFFSKRKRLKKSTPEEDMVFSEAMREEKVGFKDGLAMIVSAFLVLVLPCLLILVGICIIGMLLFGIL
ncbi:MAG: hypothetical protein IJZ89_07200 [Clostridia bacterium]|nr:hypothetical protein [Clostridia bacterium]